MAKKNQLRAFDAQRDLGIDDLRTDYALIAAGVGAALAALAYLLLT
jgi:hypothetical protein